MHKFPSSIALFLMSYPAFAAMKEKEEAAGAQAETAALDRALSPAGVLEGTAGAPVETVDVIYVVWFGIIFIGMIAGFFAYVWWRERKREPDR